MSFVQTILVTIQIAISLVPHIIEVVKAVETPGFGPEKLALVVSTIKEAFNLLPSEVLQKIGADRLESFVVKVVGFVVTFLNKVGVFKTGS